MQSPRQNASGRNTAQHLPFISKQYLLYLLEGFAIPRLLEMSAILVKSIHTAGQNNLAVTPRVSKLERAFCALTVSDLIPSFFFFLPFFQLPAEWLAEKTKRLVLLSERPVFQFSHETQALRQSKRRVLCKRGGKLTVCSTWDGTESDSENKQRNPCPLPSMLLSPLTVAGACQRLTSSL